MKSTEEKKKMVCKRFQHSHSISMSRYRTVYAKWERTHRTEHTYTLSVDGLNEFPIAISMLNVAENSCDEKPFRRFLWRQLACVFFSSVRENWTVYWNDKNVSCSVVRTTINDPMCIFFLGVASAPLFDYDTRVVRFIFGRQLSNDDTLSSICCYNIVVVVVVIVMHPIQHRW